MRINPDRLALLMRTDEFRLALANHRTGEVQLCRPATMPGLFEQIWISTYGDAQATVGSSSVVSVTGGPITCNGLYIERYHDELCSDKYETTDSFGVIHKDYFSILRSHLETWEWEERLADFAPQDVRSLANEQGQQLLARTAEARNAAARYLKLLNMNSDETDVEYLSSQLRSRLDREQLREAESLIEVAVEDSALLSCFQTAVMILQLFGDEIEGKVMPFKGQRYHDNEPLIWRVYLIIDLLVRRNAAELGKWTEVLNQ